MGVLPLIIKREFLAKIRNKSFIVMTFLSPLILAGIVALITYLSTLKADVKQIAIHDQTGWFVGQFESNDQYNYSDQSAVPLSTLRKDVAEGRYEGVLYIPQTAEAKSLEKSIRYISDDSPGIGFVASIEDIIADKLTHENYRKAQLDTALIHGAQARVNLTLEKATGEESLKGLNEIKIAIGGAFGYLIMMFIIIYGNMVMRSVIEEKTNRIIEIIISSVKPFQLMMGKIIGTSLAGIMQFFIWAIIGLGLMFAASAFLGVDVASTSGVSPEVMEQAQKESGNLALYVRELWELPIATLIISFIIYFIGGYFLYSSLYAAIGAAVDNETDSQQFLLPIIMPLMLGVYIGFFTVINDPHGTVATVFSMIPLTSPIVMLMRIPFGVPLWQILVSIALLFGTFLGVVWFAGRIYRVGILMYGKKPSYKELIKWMKY